ncbi:MAG: arsenite methyltransferase [Dehalococcoidia bacterium]|nr:arsenite methyltransferase [Dehalococcoidia bacterium]
MTVRPPDEIRKQVSKAYASRVRPLLEEETVPLIDTGCCAPASGTAAGSCCGDPAGQPEITSIARLYAETDVSDLPSTVTDAAFGCGNPTAIAALRPGQVVLDLGAGGGIDCFLAARMVGPSGRVYGVDMTPEMVALARKNATKVGATNVEFRLGEIEHLPVESDTIDVVISNCVINLSPDKDQVFREAFRVLKPGGRLQVSDVVWTRPVPESVRGDMEKWAGCVAGALREEEYTAKIAAAGFVRVESRATPYPGGQGIASASVVAEKPKV